MPDTTRKVIQNRARTSRRNRALEERLALLDGVAAYEGGFTVTFDRSYLDTHRGAELLLTAAGGRSADDWSGLRVEWSDGRC